MAVCWRSMWLSIFRVMDLVKVAAATTTTTQRQAATTNTVVHSCVVKDPFSKLSFPEFCNYYGMDIENNIRNRILWRIQLSQKVVVDEMMLDFIGYTGLTYNHKRNAFKKLLLHNTHIDYEEKLVKSDDNNENKDDDSGNQYIYVVSTLDFETLMHQIRTLKVVELRELFTLIKFIMNKYSDYEKYFEEHHNTLLLVQNSQIMAAAAAATVAAPPATNINISQSTLCRLVDLERACNEKEKYLAELERACTIKERHLSSCITSTATTSSDTCRHFGEYSPIHEDNRIIVNIVCYYRYIYDKKPR